MGKKSTTELIKQLLLTVELMEFGIQMMRQNLVRNFPNCSEQEIEKNWSIGWSPSPINL